MSLSIITPHYNDFEGLKRVFSCLLEQTSTDWEWVVVDDLSEDAIIEKVKNWIKNLGDKRIQLITNSKKTNASVCRNLGADAAQNDLLIFLDADDYISTDFVANRHVEVSEFVVFRNSAVVNKEHVTEVRPNKSKDYLNYFLKAQFIWPITSVLWNKTFFNAIGQFHSGLMRLQDVELSIRALQIGSKFTVVDNTVDFYYRVKPIRERQNFVKPVCDSVYLFISELLDTSPLSKFQLSLISSYYYLCTKYLERSESLDDIKLVQRNLNLFYKKNYIHSIAYSIGFIILKLYAWRLVSGDLFIRVNRYIFKPKKSEEF